MRWSRGRWSRGAGTTVPHDVIRYRAVLDASWCSWRGVLSFSFVASLALTIRSVIHVMVIVCAVVFIVFLIRFPTFATATAADAVNDLEEYIFNDHEDTKHDTKRNRA
jgi:hypothetical protein